MRLGKLLKNINFNYRRREEPIKTLWQEDKDFIHLKQQKMNLTTYLEKSKPMLRIVEEPNRAAHGHADIEIMCKEQNISADGLRAAEAVKFIADGKERLLGMQFIMNADCNKYGTLPDQRLRQGIPLQN